MESVRAIQDMTVVQLRAYAREKKVRLPYGVNKAKLVELLNHELREEQKEEESGTVSVRSRDEGDLGSQALDAFVQKAAADAKE